MPASQQITTVSVEQALDFACSLLSSAVAAAGEARPQEAPPLLRELAVYIEFRYVGELGLAFESLARLGHVCPAASFQSEQFWSQLEWASTQLGVSSEWRHPRPSARA